MRAFQLPCKTYFASDFQLVPEGIRSWQSILNVCLLWATLLTPYSVALNKQKLSFVWFDSLRPSQQFIGHAGTGPPGLIQYIGQCRKDQCAILKDPAQRRRRGTNPEPSLLPKYNEWSILLSYIIRTSYRWWRARIFEYTRAPDKRGKGYFSIDFGMQHYKLNWRVKKYPLHFEVSALIFNLRGAILYS